jgi:ferredoxin
MSRVFKIRFQNPAEGIDVEVPCRDDQSILEAAEAKGLGLPYSCRSAACGTCAGQVLSGEVHLEEQFVLGEDDLNRGLTCLCSAHPRADCVILTHQRHTIEGM